MIAGRGAKSLAGSWVGRLVVFGCLLAVGVFPSVASAKGSGPPVNTVAPTAKGTPAEGQKLKAVKGTWTGASKIVYAYQWQACDPSGNACVEIPLATKSSLKLAGEQVGHTIRITVKATNPAGTLTVASAQTGLVTSPAPVNSNPPVISGIAQVGSLVTVSNGTWTGSPTSYSYQWQACNSSGASCSNITGAIGPGYRPTRPEVAGTLRAIVTASNAGGQTSATSAASGIIAPGTAATKIALCGEIKSNTTLTPEAADVYIITCNVKVPAKVTLTIASGAIIKAESATGLTVNGTLQAVGATGLPITFTSVNDNSVGVALGTGTPVAGEVRGIEENGSSAAMNLQHVNISYAEVAIVDSYSTTVLTATNDILKHVRQGIGITSAPGGANITNDVISQAQDGAQVAGEEVVATFSGDAIENAELALAVSSGRVSYRGTFSEDKTDIQACPWPEPGTEAHCVVDAAYNYWGSPSGPDLESTTPLTCGVVFSSPWYTEHGFGGATARGSVFGDANCESAATPQDALSQAAAAAEGIKGATELLCNGGEQSACDALKNYLGCFNAAVTAVQNTLPFPISNDPAGAASAAGNYLATAENATVSTTGETLAAVGDVATATKAIVALTKAYDTCFP